MEPNNNQVVGEHDNKGVLGKIILVVVLLLAVFLVIKFMGIGGGEDIVNTEYNTVEEHNDTNSTPPGLPVDLPVEGNALSESIKTNYVDNNTALYSVAYTSTATAAAKYAEYEAYMNTAGYTLSSTAEDRTSGVIKGVDVRGNSLMVIITTQGGKTHVQIAYTEKLGQ